MEGEWKDDNGNYYISGQFTTDVYFNDQKHYNIAGTFEFSKIDY